jgi:hypothetical protein
MYGHNYLLEEQHLAEIKANAKKAPCPTLNKGAQINYLLLLIFKEKGLQARPVIGVKRVVMGIIAQR